MIQHQRLLVLTGLFTMALGLSLAIKPAVLPFYGLAMAGLASTSVPYLLHTHPDYRFTGRRLILPAAIALAAPTVAHELGSGPFRLVGVFGPGALLYGVILAEHVLIPHSAGLTSQAARLVLSVTAFGTALSYFLLAYEVKERSIISGPLLGLVTGALAFGTLTLEVPATRRTLLYAAAIGLSMAEVFWPLNYWTFGTVAGGLALLLAFYILLGIARPMLTAQFDRAILVEYGGVALAGALIVLGASHLPR